MERASALRRKTVSRKLPLLSLVLATMLLLAPIASADTFGGVTFDVTNVTSTSFTVTVTGSTCTVFAGCNWLGEVSFGVLNVNNDGPTSTSESAGWLSGALGTVGGNGGPGGAGDCSTSNTNKVCWKVDPNASGGGGGSLSGPYSYSFTANFDAADVKGPLDAFHVQASFYNGSVSSANKVGQISEDLNGDGPPPNGQIPEPSSMVLFGTGLISIGGLLRRRMKG